MLYTQGHHQNGRGGCTCGLTCKGHFSFQPIHVITFAIIVFVGGCGIGTVKL